MISHSQTPPGELPGGAEESLSSYGLPSSNLSQSLFYLGESPPGNKQDFLIHKIALYSQYHSGFRKHRKTGPQNISRQFLKREFGNF